MAAAKQQRASRPPSWPHSAAPAGSDLLSRSEASKQLIVLKHRGGGAGSPGKESLKHEGRVCDLVLYKYNRTEAGKVLFFVHE